MNAAGLIFPHQLFENVLFPKGTEIFLVEEFLFFKQYTFHKEKIAFHRATMKAYADYLTKKKFSVHYVEALEDRADIRVLIPWLAKQGVSIIHLIDPTDDWLSRRIESSSRAHQISLRQEISPLFINTPEENKSFFKPDKKKFFQTKFYIAQRKKLNILLDDSGNAQGGKWSYDAENRKKYPKGKTPPPIHYPDTTSYYSEAVTYTQKNFKNNPGEISDSPRYPITFSQSKGWLKNFLAIRFHEFGPYEDAIVKEESILNHSVLTPMLNVGLLLPGDIVQEALDFSDKENVPINSTEGFVRQIIGWREFIRGIYECKGRQERTRNFWGFTRKIPPSFYDGTTGLPPVDQTIKKVLQTGYCHHIERLMVLGNIMVLCEFDPDEVYRWFMELFIDAYDWVMVPNVYGMSQFADGGLMSTKPYISGSNYILKMSNYPKGDWQKTWDGLFWRFMHVHREFFLKNPRMGMLIRTFDKMDEEKKQRHKDNAEKYLESLG